MSTYLLLLLFGFSCLLPDVTLGSPAGVMAQSRISEKEERAIIELLDMLGEEEDQNTATIQQAITAGVTYVRWGNDACPNGADTLYSGRMAGAFYNKKGGGANHLCLPDDPEYNMIDTKSSRKDSLIYGTEYEHPIVGVHNRGVPCAVCLASTRQAQFMLPAKTTCPPGWHTEYMGYIMSEGHWKSRSRSEYLCIDREQVSVRGSAANKDGSLLYHVKATCHGIECPPYDSNKALSCAVCTK